MSNVDEIIQKSLESGSFSERQVQQLYEYERLLVETNKVMNLTSIVDHEGIWFRHFLDSYTVVQSLKEQPNISLIDVGTGGGFPGMIIAIFRPDVTVTLMDATKKKLVFLQKVIDQLSLTNVRLLHGRAEEISHSSSYRESFDYATTRAVSSLSTCLEICVGLVKVDGFIIAMRGPQAPAELKEVKNKLDLFSLSDPQIGEFANPHSGGESYVLSFRKNRPTNKNYPRSYARIVSNK